MLVADDNETNRIVMRDMLEEWEIKPMLADNGTSALRHLENAYTAHTPFSLVLFDANMPGMDGIALAERIRKDRKFDACKLMMLSSVGSPDAITCCRELSIHRILAKPLKHSSLLHAIHDAFDSTSKEKSFSETLGVSRCANPLKILLAEDNPINQKVAVGFRTCAGITSRLPTTAGKRLMPCSGAQWTSC